MSIPSTFNFFAAIIESSDDAIIGKGLDGKILSWNKGAEKIYGYTEKEVLGKSITILFPPERKDEFKYLMGHIKKDEAIKNFETQRITKYGKRLDVSVTISPIKNEKGEIVAASTIGRDITQRKRAERNAYFLAEATKMLSSSLNYKTTLAGIAKIAVPYIADWCLVDLMINKKLVRVALTHKDPKKIKWAHELSKKYPPDKDSTRGVYKVLKTGNPEMYPQIPDEMLVNFAKDKEQLKLMRSLGFTSAMIVPMKIRNKAVGGITFITSESGYNYTNEDLALAEELARRAALAIENAALYRQAKHAVELRDEFISIASHELKTPITSMKIYLDSLKRHLEKNFDPQSSTYYSRMHGQLDKLNRLVEDLLSVSRLKSGKLDLDIAPFNLNNLVKEIVETSRAISQKHRIIIHGEVPPKVYGDRGRLAQVISNLLSNSIKYSPDGGKVIIILGKNGKSVYVKVQDFGIGIEKEEQKKIFDQFYRVRSSEDSATGLGMGLYIANEIIKRHGGRMSVESEKGKGSMFGFTIPSKT